MPDPQNAPMSEVPPGQTQNPQTPTGNQSLQGVLQLLALLKQQQQAKQSAGGQSTPAVVPQLPQGAFGGGPAPSTPGGGGGGTGAAVAPPPMAQQPSAPAQSGPPSGSVTGSNAAVRNANVAKSAADAMGQAVTAYKVKKNTDDVAKAQSSYQQYQQALAAGDMQTANYIATNPKIISSWEKYLNEYIVRVPGGPAQGGKGQPQGPTPGINQPGGLAVPRDMKPPDPQAQAKLQLTQAQAGEAQSLSKLHDADAAAKSVETDTNYVKAQAELLQRTAEISAAEAKVQEIQHKLSQDAETAGLPGQKPVDAQKAGILRDLAAAQKSLADARKAEKEQKEKTNMAGFTAASNRIKDVDTEVSKDVATVQKQSSKVNSDYEKSGVFNKVFGTKPDDPSTSPEAQAMGNRLKAVRRTKVDFNNMQDDVVSGKISVQDAQTKTRRANGLDSNYEIWGGVPQGAPPSPPKGTVDGSALRDADGNVVAVAAGGQWVAP